MSFPLIIEPSPLTQLAELLETIRQRQEARREREDIRSMRALQAQVARQNISESQAQISESQARIANLAEDNRRQARLDAERRRMAKEQQQGLARFIEGLPPDMRLPVGALVQVGDALPAEVRTAIFQRLAGSETVDQQGYNRWLSTWRTGVPTALQSANAARIPLPPGIPPGARVPSAVAVFGGNQAFNAQVSRRVSALSAINAIINDYQQDQVAVRERVTRELLGPRANVVAPTPDQQRQILTRVNRVMQQRYPRITSQFERRDQLQRELDQLSQTGALQAESDSLDVLIDSIPDVTPRPRR